MLGRTDRRWRSVAILGVMCVFAVVAVIRLAYWQVAMASELQARAQGQLQHAEAEHAVRGDILDRNGIVLATTGYRDTLASWPNKITTEQRIQTVEGLAHILDMDRAERAAVDAKMSTRSAYQPIRRELTEEQSRQIHAGISANTLFGLTLIPHQVRIYPNPGGQPGTTLASHLLGFVTSADGASIGQYGIEQQYDAILAGRPKLVAMARDRYGRSLESSAQVLQAGADGEDVTISIDASLQLQLEKELYAAWVADKAKRVSGLVMDPGSGQLLAWASVPGYDANDAGNEASRDPGLVQDPIVSQPYEPGSVMKMLTATSAIENKVIKPSSRVMDSAALRFGPGQVVHNWDGLGEGRLTFRDVIALSRNVGVSRVAARLGRTIPRAAATLYKTWRKMGIGVKTGVDVPGEVPGRAVDPRTSPWMPIDLANRAFGQAVTATPIQLAVAFTPMINGGLRVQPHFLVSIGGRPQVAAAAHRVLTRKVAGRLQGILQHVTSSVWWYAKGSLIPHYQVGGKTGTAQIWRSDRKMWDRRYYNFTFVGYVGGDAPDAIVAVHIDEAKSLPNRDDEIKLNITSYQLFRSISRGIIRSLEIRRSTDPEAGKPEPGSVAEAVLAEQRVIARNKAARRQHARAHEARHSR